MRPKERTTPKTKKCKTCNRRLAASKFYKDPRHLDGLYSSCRKCFCRKKRQRDSLPERKLSAALYYREVADERTAIARKRYRSDEAYREKRKKQVRISSKKYYQRNKDKIRARSAVRSLVESGKVVRPSVCPDCGKRRNVEAHHSDYSKPLDFTWKCKKCHRLLEWKERIDDLKKHMEADGAGGGSLIRDEADAVVGQQ